MDEIIRSVAVHRRQRCPKPRIAVTLNNNRDHDHAKRGSAYIHRNTPPEAEGGKGSRLQSKSTTIPTICPCRANVDHPIQPKFLTKAQRAELALAKRNQEELERREKEERERKDRDALEREAEEFRVRDRDRNRESRYGSSGTRRQCLR